MSIMYTMGHRDTGGNVCLRGCIGGSIGGGGIGGGSEGVYWSLALLTYVEEPEA
jgi:hypothetical protein